MRYEPLQAEIQKKRLALYDAHGGLDLSKMEQLRRVVDSYRARSDEIVVMFRGRAVLTEDEADMILRAMRTGDDSEAVAWSDSLVKPD